MRIEGRIEIGPYGGTSKSARRHQPYLVTDAGERLRLRRHDGPSMRDEELEAIEGRQVMVEGIRRSGLFIARSLTVSGGSPPRPVRKDASRRVR